MYYFIFSIFFISIFSTYGTENPCVFCKPKVIKDQLVFESEHFNIMLDYAPRMFGHILVVTKRHLEKAHELSREEWAELSNIIPRIVQVFSEFLDTEDYIIIERNGRAAFQDVPHAHFHLHPVHSETWSEIFETSPKRLSKEELKQLTTLFKSYFALRNTVKSF